jgi:hypothetical protein
MATVYLTVGLPIDIPMQIAKWLAICEVIPCSTRSGNGHEAQHVCYPTDLQILEDGRLRVLFSVLGEGDLHRINFGAVPFIGVYTDRVAREALLTKPIPSWIIWLWHARRKPERSMHSAIASAKNLAEILLATMYDLHTIGAKDHDTLRAVFDHSVRYNKHGSHRRLTDGQLASILELADQCRQRLASPPPSLPVDDLPGLDSSSPRSGSPPPETRPVEPTKPPPSKIHAEDLIKLYKVRYLPPSPGALPWLTGKSPADIRRQSAALSA